eukprot:gene9766-11404_t
MEGTGRNEILNWLNDTLQLSYTKIEQTSTGAAHCQLLDMLYPGKVNLAKVLFNAKYDYEYIQNLNIVRETFTKCGIDKYQGFMDVDKMVLGRPQANLEFCQWMKKFFDAKYSGEPYNALERRVHVRANYEPDKALLAALGPNAPKPPPKTGATKTAATTKPAAAKPVAAPVAVTKPVAAAPKPVAAPVTAAVAKKPVAAKPAPVAASTPAASAPRPSTLSKPATTKPTISQPSFKPTATKPKPTATATTPEPPVIVEKITTIVDPTLVKEVEEKSAQIEQLGEEVAQLKLTIEEIEKDRDFFYTKLRDVEIYCQESESAPDINAEVREKLKHILEILYQTDQAAEGDEVEGDGEVEGDEQVDGQENIGEEAEGAHDEEEQLEDQEEDQIIDDEEEELIGEDINEDEENEIMDEILAEEEEDLTADYIEEELEEEF